jgi:ferredoxin
MNASGQIVVKLKSGEHQKIPVPAGTRSLADVLAAHGLPLNMRCGERGFCRGCEVDLRDGLLMVVDAGVTALATRQVYRARASGPSHILIHACSGIEHKPQVGETFEIVIPYAHQTLGGRLPRGQHFGRGHRPTAVRQSDHGERRRGRSGCGHQPGPGRQVLR